jgi:hypothetical protein
MLHNLQFLLSFNDKSHKVVSRYDEQSSSIVIRNLFIDGSTYKASQKIFQIHYTHMHTGFLATRFSMSVI